MEAIDLETMEMFFKVLKCKLILNMDDCRLSIGLIRGLLENIEDLLVVQEQIKTQIRLQNKGLDLKQKKTNLVEIHLEE